MRRHPHDIPRAPRTRRGMSLVEVIVAVVILGGALTSLAVFTGRFTRAAADSRLRITAEQLASERLEQARGSGTYAALDSFARVEDPVNGFPGYRRQTFVQRTGGTVNDSLDYRTVTVAVSHASLPAPVRQTTIISVF